MNKGNIFIDTSGEVIVITANLIDNYIGGQDIQVEEYPVHPYCTTMRFKHSEEVKYLLANECKLHYPSYCDCYKKTTYALIIQENKLSLIKRLKKIFKR